MGETEATDCRQPMQHYCAPHPLQMLTMHQQMLMPLHVDRFEEVTCKTSESPQISFCCFASFKKKPRSEDHLMIETFREIMNFDEGL
jgi:hypothetical protein